MAVTDSITLDVLKFLKMNGLSTRGEIERSLGRLSNSTLGNLRYLGHISSDNTLNDGIRYAITPKGIKKVGRPGVMRNKKERLQQFGSAGGKNYLGLEMQSSSRHRAMQAYELPSRVGLKLYWPDGRVTAFDRITPEKP